MTDRFVTVPDSLERPAAVKVGVDRLHDSTVAGRALLTGADAAAQRSSLGLGTAAVADAADFLPSGGSGAGGRLGTHALGPVSGSVTINTDQAEQQALTATGPITLSLSGACQVTAALTQDATGGRAVTLGAGIVIASGVALDVDPTPAAETVMVFRPRASSGWVMEGCWLSVAGVPNTIVVPTAPTFTDLSGTAQDTYIIPSQAGVQYRVGGVVEAAGAHPATGTVTITAEAATGYEIGSGATTSWEFTYTDITTIPVGTPATLAEAISNYGATGYWKLDEASGTTITDYSGNNNHGTLAGTAGTDYTLAAQNGYLEFKTATGKITVPDHNGYSIPADGAITVFMLERRATLGGGRALINKTATNQGEWSMVALSAVVQAILYIPTNQLISAKQSGDIPTAAWCAHWTILRRPSVPMSYPEHYVNSTALSSGAADSGSPTTNYANGTAPLNIGGGVIGAVGEVAIFPWALTTAHIQKMLDLARAEGLIP